MDKKEIAKEMELLVGGYSFSTNPLRKRMSVVEKEEYLEDVESSLIQLENKIWEIIKNIEDSQNLNNTEDKE
jgi:hypothetical protein